MTDINGGSTTSVINDSNNTKLTTLADGSYNLSAGKYTVVYTGINSSPATVTQNVTIKQAPVSVNVHYYNPRGYTGWNFWKWGDGNGTSINFSGTSTATDGSVWDNGSLTYDTSATDGNFRSPSFTSVNFIVRQSTAQNAWAAQTQNLSVALNPDGTPTHSDIYVVAGDNTHVYYDEASAMEAYTKAQEVVNMDWSKFDSQYDYEGTMGAIYSPASTTFKVWTPTTDVAGVAKVQLVDYGATTNSAAYLTLTAKRVIDMTQGTVASTDPTQNTIGLWSTVVAGDMKNHVYTYHVTYTDGTVKETQDPYSTVVIVNGQKSVVVDPADTAPAGFVAAQGAAATWRVSDPSKAIIQEMNIRDFTINSRSGVSAVNAGKYLGVIQAGTKNSSGAATGLDYLKQLGVNYVQIMPEADFASVDETGAGSQQNWGDDPENYNVPEGSYSSNPENPVTRILEFKQMVQGLHNSGIGVIMDVVYPHQANQSTSPFQIVAPNYYFRLSNGSGCGNDTASERDMYSDYIVNSVLNWVQTYVIDGFRFDQMMQIYTATMNEIRAKLSAIDPNIILYGEGWNGGMTALPDSQKSNQDNIQQIPGIGVFNDIARDSIKGSDVYSQTNPKNGFVNGLSTGNGVFADTEAAVADVIMGTHTGVEGKSIPALSPSQIINFVEVHDNATLNDLIWKENPLDDQATHNLRVQLANAINLLAQGVPLMETGQEFDRTKEPGTLGNSTDQTVFATASNSYNAGDSVNGVDWNLATTNSNMVNFIQQVIAFRKVHPAFQLNSYAAIANQVKIANATVGSGVITYEVTEGANTYLVIYNASGKALSLGLDGGLYQTTNFTNSSVQVSDAVSLTANKTVGSSTVTVSDLSATVLLLNPTSQFLPTTPTTTTPDVTPTTSTTTTPVVTAPSATITPVLSTNSNAVYRLYNQKTGQHLWTVNTLEVSTLKNAGWKIEHSSLTSISQGIPVYRLYNAKTRDRFYTTNLLERNHAIKALGYQSEGIAFDVPNTGEKEYRLYNSTSKLHFYTTDMNEIVTIIKNGYHLEGLAWHV